MKVISLFSGCGGLDLGFEQAGYQVVAACEKTAAIWETYERNHPKTQLFKADIRRIKAEDFPDCDGIIGGPPCQSWSEAGTKRPGDEDERGKLFNDYLRILKEKKPLFFLCENVPGMLLQRNQLAFERILQQFYNAGYNIQATVIDASEWGVAQTRRRLFFIGIRKDFGLQYSFPVGTYKRLTLRDVIGDLTESPPVASTNVDLHCHPTIANHEYLEGGFSSRYLSRCRVRVWQQPSYTILATDRHIPIHPDGQMAKVCQEKWELVGNCRRFSVRECARIQGFPDDFIFYYDTIKNGYKMVGNAVPVPVAKALAKDVKRKIANFR